MRLAMPTVNLKNRGIVLLLCLASFTLGRFLIAPELAPSHWFAVNKKAPLTPIGRYDSTNIKSRTLQKGSQIGWAGSDLDTPSERFSAFDPIEETPDHSKEHPGFDSEADEDDKLNAGADRRLPITNQNKDEQAISNDDKATVEDDKEMTKDDKAFVLDDKATVEDDKATIEDHKEMTKDDKATVEDDKATIEDHKEMTKDDKATVEDDKATIEDDKAIAEDHRATVEDDKATVDDDKATVEDDKATVEDDKATIEDHKEMTKDDKATIEDDKATIEDHKEMTKDHRATVEDDKATVEDDKATIEDHKEMTKDDKATVEDDKATVEDDKAIAEDHRATVDDDKATVDDDKATVGDDKAITKQSPPKNMPVVKHNRILDIRYSVTPDQLLDRALKFISPEVKASFANITGLKYNNKTASVIWSNFSIHKKWSVLTAGMRKLGYEQRLPTVICLGVKKSGTTAILHFLVQHSQITRALLEEVHYFSIDYERGIDYYRARMGFSSRNMLQFEKSPSYFAMPNVAPRMRKDLPPNVKFVICVRDPVERTISDFRHESELNLNRNANLARGETPASQAKHFEESIFNHNGEVDLSEGWVSESLYSSYFKNWLEQFPRNRFYILSQERVNKDLYSELKNLEKFLGLESFYERSMFYFNEQRQAPCMRSGCPYKSTPGFLPKAKLSPGTMKKLRDFFRPYNQEFEQLTQMNFSWTNL